MKDTEKTQGATAEDEAIQNHWAEFLYHRAGLIRGFTLAGKTPVQIAATLSCDPGAVVLIAMTPASSFER